MVQLYFSNRYRIIQIDSNNACNWYAGIQNELDIHVVYQLLGEHCRLWPNVTMRKIKGGAKFSSEECTKYAERSEAKFFSNVTLQWSKSGHPTCDLD